MRPGGTWWVRALALTMLALAVPGCLRLGRDRPAPPVVERYFRALADGDYAGAYRMTELSVIQRNVKHGSALSLEHFEAFWRASALRDYRIEKVTQLEQRTIGTLNQRGAPHYVVDVRLERAEGTLRETVSVEGDVLPKVQVEPDQVFLRVRRDVRTVEVDGVQTTVRRGSSTDPYPLMLMRGRHRIRVAGVELTVTTQPLSVEGPARIESGGIVVDA